MNLQASLGQVTVTFVSFFFCDTFHYTLPTGSALSIFIKRAGKITYTTRFLQGKVDQGAPVYKSATETQGVTRGSYSLYSALLSTQINLRGMFYDDQMYTDEWDLSVFYRCSE